MLKKERYGPSISIRAIEKPWRTVNVITRWYVGNQFHHIYITMERSTIFNGKIIYFYGQHVHVSPKVAKMMRFTTDSGGAKSGLLRLAFAL